MKGCDVKLRIRGNSLRLRLTRGEVSSLKDIGYVEEQIAFGPGPGQSLIYSLKVSRDGSEIKANYENNKITVNLPLDLATEWIDTDKVGLEWGQLIDNEKFLKLLIEKDFACLTERRPEEDADTFPHPQEGQLKC
jgi:hypothetical protein